MCTLCGKYAGTLAGYQGACDVLSKDFFLMSHISLCM
uniref:Uncharacterized protein n=1 Tax=Anguilla anguilla TaxID=7936 RepID=A0A0E9VM17_ANGAN